MNNITIRSANFGCERLHKRFTSESLQRKRSDSSCLTRVCVVTGQGLLLPGRGLGAARELSCPFRRAHSTTEHRKNWGACPCGQRHVKNQTEDVHSIPTTAPERWSKAWLDACFKAAALEWREAAQVCPVNGHFQCGFARNEIFTHLILLLFFFWTKYFWNGVPEHCGYFRDGYTQMKRVPTGKDRLWWDVSRFF